MDGLCIFRLCLFFFFFKQKTAYEMRISDWSSDVCSSDLIPEPIDLIVCDASFIALSKVLPVPMSFAKPGARIVALIKPQFEAERHEVGKKGVVRDAAVHERVCAEVRSWLTGEGWDVAEDRKSTRLNSSH